MKPGDYWEHLYRHRTPTEVSWYQPEARLSLTLIRRAAPDRSAPILDVGGGASTLVDGLLDAGYEEVAVLDIAPSALVHAQERLGPRARRVRWLTADILGAALPAAGYAVWHDRAVFHFLTDPDDRVHYVTQVRRAVCPDGYLIMASFGSDGPTQCSGLDVVPHTPETIRAELGADFSLLESLGETHWTPGGSTQAFIYCLFRVDAGPRPDLPSIDSSRPAV